MTNKFHKFHIVDSSPWPIIAAFAVISLTASIVTWTQYKIGFPVAIAISAAAITAYQWWRDITREASIQGTHPVKVVTGLKIGIILFITSEILFFISFFWAYFHRGISPNIEIGQNWPPNSILAFNPINVPLLNTIILLSSGVSVTWAHHRILKNKFNKRKISLLITVILGIYFTLLQGLEYWQAEFTISDSTYGSTFFIATGFHGLHVIIGTIFLLTCYKRLTNLNNIHNHLIGFEAAAWYWHFVDIVWLFLYSSIYWWGAYFLSIKSTVNFQLTS